MFNAITIQQSGVLTSGSAVVTGLTDTTNAAGNTPMSPGMPVSGTGIQAATVILSVDSATQVTLSLPATASATTPLVFAPHGVGDGATTFGIPNRAYVAVGRDNASGSATNINQVSTTFSITTGTSAAVVASATGLAVGMYASAPKLPFGTKITAIVGTAVTLSNNATATVVAGAIRFSLLADAQTVGAVGGALSQTTTLVIGNLPTITSVNPTQNIVVSSAIGNIAQTSGGVTQDLVNSGSSRQMPYTGGNWSGSGTLSGSNAITVTANGTASTPIIKPTVQPTIVMNYIIKR